eukprot:1856802-Amphidinium_carterae.1
MVANSDLMQLVQGFFLSNLEYMILVVGSLRAWLHFLIRYLCDRCSHVRQLLHVIENTAGDTVYSTDVFRLQLLVLGMAACPVAKSTLHALVLLLAQSIDRACQDAPPSRPIKFIRHLFARKRKMRVDEDFKRAMVVSEIQSGRIKSSGSGAVAFEAAKSLTGGVRRWTQKHMQQYLHSLRATFSSCPTVVIATDGKRVGNPAEMTEVFICCSSCTDCAAFMTPVVPSPYS